MNSDQIISLIKGRRAEHYDRTFAAGPETTDAGIIESAQRAREFVEEYDTLLAMIGSAEATPGK
jgi:hypothetical protein